MMMDTHSVVCGVAGLQAFFYCFLSVLMCTTSEIDDVRRSGRSLGGRATGCPRRSARAASGRTTGPQRSPGRGAATSSCRSPSPCSCSAPPGARRRPLRVSPRVTGWYFCWAAAVNCFSCYALYVAYDAMKVPCCLLLVLWHAAVVLTQIGDEADHAALHFKMLAGWCVALAAALLGAPSL